MLKKTICTVAAALTLTGCMSDREYQLRKHQLQNQAAHPPTYELFTVSGPFKLELAEGGAAKVAVPNQPFQAIPLPDGAATQAGVAKFLGGAAAATVLGWKALDGAGSTSVMKNSNNTTTTTTNGGCY